MVDYEASASLFVSCTCEECMPTATTVEEAEKLCLPEVRIPRNGIPACIQQHVKMPDGLTFNITVNIVRPADGFDNKGEKKK
jgi:hypothetical protein